MEQSFDTRDIIGDVQIGSDGVVLDQIFLTGAVTTGGHERIELYTALADVCRRFTRRIHTPLDTMAFRGSDEERYRQAMSWVSTSKLIVAEATLPSTGQGMELQEACRNDIPVIVVHEAAATVSGLVRGLPMLREIISYRDADEASRRLADCLSQLVGGRHG
jgi:hypothetical protein